MMPENTPFSASGEDAIARTIDVESTGVPDGLSCEDFEDYYDINRTVDEIIRGDYKRIALQFPDELLRDSVPIYRLLKSRLASDKELYVLADTSYGSCCVDEVAAQHVDADAMVHYGHACMSQPSRLPVIYVFGKKDVDPADCVDKLLQSAKASASTKRTVFLRHDVVYAHIADSIVEKLQGALAHSAVVVYSPVPLISYPSDMQRDTTRPGESLDDAQSRTNSNENRASQSLAEDSIVLYIGGESLSLTNLLLTHASCEVHSYDPATRAARLESSRTNRLLMRRYAVVQKARDADVFGILVGTLGVASYLPLISHLRALISRAHKKSYTISVGKLNPAKLANFLEIECFILVACPENSLIEAKEFLRPIITPYELEVALRAEQSWTGRYVLDFDKLLAEHRNRPEEENVKDLDQPEFSLVTGKYRHAKRYGDSAASAAVNGDESSLAAVVLRNQANTVALLSDSAAGQFLQTRTFRGLETRVGQDAPGMLEQGRSGIARGYQDDHRQQHGGNE